MKLLKNLIPLNNISILILFFIQLIVFYLTKNDFLSYYFLTISLLLLLLSENKLLVIVLQFVFMIFNPIVALKTILTCVLFLWTKNLKEIKIRYTTFILIIFFGFLVYFEQNQVVSLFPGLVAFSAIMYYTARIRASLKTLTTILPAYIISIVIYTFIYISYTPLNSIKPIFSVPIDIIQILFSVLIYSIFQKIIEESNQKEADNI